MGNDTDLLFSECFSMVFVWVWEHTFLNLFLKGQSLELYYIVLSHKVTMEESRLNAYIDSIQQLGAHNGVVSGLNKWFIVGRPRTW